MLRLKKRNRAGASNRKPRLLLWLALASLVFGIVEFGAPLDLTLRTLRDKVRAQPVSGEIVVVGIDDKALELAGTWPWNRSHLAALTDRMFAGGAKHIYFDLYFQPLEPKGDAKLAEAIGRYPGRVSVASVVDFSEGNPGGRPVLPMPAIAKGAETLSVMKWIRFWNGVSSVPYRTEIGGKVRRSMESAISGVDGAVDEQFPVDYSHQLSSIPYISAADILIDPNAAKRARGKTVIVGVNTATLGDVFTVPGQRRAAGVFVIAIGAETLMKGRPVSIGWFPAWVIALCAMVYFIHGQRRRLALLAGLGGTAAILTVPIALEHFNIFADIAPALFLCFTALVVRGWQGFGARKQSEGAINPVSGLRTVNAIFHEKLPDSNIVVAVRVHRFTDIVSMLPPDAEREFVGQIVSRLAMGAGEAQLLHGDDGNFFWLLPLAELASVVDQFKALHLIFRNPVKVMDKRFDVDVTFGVDQEVGMPLSHRLSSALAAAHAASEEGNYWKLHDPSDAGAKEWALSLLGELDDAISAGQVWVAYQPKMDLATRRITGAEALVRWTHPTRGPINPAEFVEMAERHGRIDGLTAFVLNDAATVVAAALAQNPDFTISVNVSPSLLTTRDIVVMVADTLQRHGLPASCLVLEVTETAAMAEGQFAISLLEELRAMGVALSIDDYGTGLSTLEYLRRIPASELKVDKRFTMSLDTSPEDRAVMRSTIELAHTLGMKVVAEGIETAETLQTLRAMGCEIGQGFHIGRPMEGSSLVEMIRPHYQKVADG